MGIDLSSIQSISLDDLVGGAADPLPYTIYQAQMAIVGLREQLKDADQVLVDYRNACLAELYAQPGGAGKNEKERSVTEQRALNDFNGYNNARDDRDIIARRLADAEAELAWAQDRFKAICAKARVMAALLEYAGAMRLPLAVIANSQKQDVTSTDEMPF